MYQLYVTNLSYDRSRLFLASPITQEILLALSRKFWSLRNFMPLIRMLENQVINISVLLAVKSVNRLSQLCYSHKMM
jgi:hypothetical protein